MAETGRFLTGSTMGHVVRMTMTGAMGITFVCVVYAANLFWIAKLGDPRLMAAIGYAFAIQYFSVSAGIGLMIAATAIISRSIGAGAPAAARRQTTSAAITAFAIQSVVAALIVVFRDPILELSGATGETAARAARCLAISVPSLGLMAFAMIANGALRAVGDGKRSMFVTLTAGAVAIIVDPVLIYGLGMGLDGAALGIALSRFVMLGMALLFAIRVHDLMAAPRLGDIAATLRPFLMIALPAILTQLATPMGNYLLTTVMSQFGDAAMAGWAVVGRLTVVAFGGIFSLAGAIGGIFGQNFGACAYDRLRSTYRDAILFGIGYTLVTWFLLVLATETLIAAFDVPPEAGGVVRAFTHVGAGGFIFASALFVSNAAFNALGRPGWSTVTNWLRDGVLSLPLALMLSGWFLAPGVIYAQAAAAILTGVLAGLWGWHFVCSMSRRAVPALDLDPPRPYAHADRFRRR